jgi:DNA-binding NarL/FixJ family response regulator
MEKRRVLLLCVESLLSESLERILGQLEDVELVGPWRLDADVLTRLPEDMPDIALIVQEAEESESVASLTSQILERYPDLPIVRIGLTENVIRVYASQTLPARSADLIEVIRSLPVYQPETDPKGF